MKSRLEKALEYIQGYCNKHASCEKCKLKVHETGFCRLEQNVPCDQKVRIKEIEENEID